jgi:dTDP-4-dehydrorhamnose 3,5-epimerase/epimerase EvaD
MRTRELAVTGAFEFTPRVLGDRRGLFVSPMQEQPFVAVVGARFPVAQTNHSLSARGVLRGVHYTATPPGQAKYVYCASGHARDVVVDLRVGSPTFGKWDSVELESREFRAVYLPVGVGHAFLALADQTVMSYMVSTAYQPELEMSIDALDPELNLPWPSDIDLIRIDRDISAPRLADALPVLPRYADCLPKVPTSLERR